MPWTDMDYMSSLVEALRRIQTVEPETDSLVRVLESRIRVGAGTRFFLTAL